MSCSVTGGTLETSTRLGNAASRCFGGDGGIDGSVSAENWGAAKAGGSGRFAATVVGRDGGGEGRGASRRWISVLGSEFACMRRFTRVRSSDREIFRVSAKRARRWYSGAST